MFSDFITFRFVINTKIASDRLTRFSVFNIVIINWIASDQIVRFKALKIRYQQ